MRPHLREAANANRIGPGTASLSPAQTHLGIRNPEFEILHVFFRRRHKACKRYLTVLTSMLYMLAK